MAALTWRNVDAPDFRTALEGVRQSGQMFDKAFDRAGDTLTDIDGNISERVNTQLQLEILAANTPDKAKAVAANLAMDPNAKRISTQTMAAARGRATELLTEKRAEIGVAADQDDLDNNRVTRARQVKQWAASDAAKPFMAALLTETDPEKQKAIMTANPQIFGDLTFEELKSATSAARDSAKAPLELESLRVGTDSVRQATKLAGERHVWDGERYKRELRDDNERRLADKLYLKLNQYGLDGADTERYINENPDEFRGYSPTVLASARARVIAERGGLQTSDFAGGDSGGGGPIPGAGGGTDGAGIGDALIESVLPGAKITGRERSAKRNKEVGGASDSFHLEGNGVEAFDIRVGTGARTYAEALAKMKAKYGDRLVEAKNEENRPGYPPHWHFAVRTVGMDPAKYLGLTPSNSKALGAKVALDQAVKGDPVNEFASFIANGGGNITDVGAVARNLISGNFKGENQGQVERDIVAIQNKYTDPNRPGVKLTAEQAGWIMNRSRTSAKTGIQSLFGFGAQGQNFDKKLMDQLGAAYLDTPKFLKLVGRADAVNRTRKGIDRAAADETAAIGADARRRQALSRLGRKDPYPSNRAPGATATRDAVNEFGKQLGREVAPVPDPQVVRAARGVLRLGGVIAQREEAKFVRTYGMTPQEALRRSAGL
jgi:hypothetical protein